MPKRAWMDVYQEVHYLDHVADTDRWKDGDVVYVWDEVTDICYTAHARYDVLDYVADTERYVSST